MKRFLTFTIIAGSKSCVNDCPICISKMTPECGIGNKKPEIDWEKFEKSIRIALNHNAGNVLITGKGEPTLFPGQITQYLIRLYKKPFDRIELQTNGYMLAQGGSFDEFLDVWKDLGLDVVAVSIYHYDSKMNGKAFRPKNGRYFDLPKLIEKIHSKGLSVRLSCVMLQGYVDSVEEVKKLIEFAKQNGVFELSLRSADRPKKLSNSTVARRVAAFVSKNKLSDEKFKKIKDFLDKEGTVCDMLPHGAVVYEIYGQNICLTTGLSYDAGREEIRQLIFFPQGWLTTSWENVGGCRLL